MWLSVPAMVSVPLPVPMSMPMLPVLLALVHAVLQRVGGDGADRAPEHGAESAPAELVREEAARAAAYQRRA